MVYSSCSNGQLTFVPSPSQQYGVLERTAPSDICGVHYSTVAGNLGININDYDADHIMFVMPDCVEWGNAAGWAQAPGSLSWYPNQYVHLPVTQVHEMGHNFGHRHSGKGGVGYADDTGYMGNKALWTDVGSKMCFNPAKTWFFGWYSDWHETVYPANAAYNNYLIGIDEVNSQGATVNDIVLKVDNPNGPPLYVMYNLATGRNAGVPGDRNKVIVTEQLTQWTESAYKAGLGYSESYTQYNWGGSGNALVITYCNMEYGSPNRVHVIVYLAGSGHVTNCNNVPSPVPAPPVPAPPVPAPPVPAPPVPAPPTPASGSETVNMPEVFNDSFLLNAGIEETPINQAANTSIETTGIVETVCTNIKDWYDADGEEFNCDWYAAHARSDRCKKGQRHPRKGHTASTACCSCGGGLEEAVEVEPVYYEQEAIYYDADGGCQDTLGWQDSGGNNCEWYAGYPTRCVNSGDGYSNFGETANQACCFCQQ